MHRGRDCFALVFAAALAAGHLAGAEIPRGAHVLLRMMNSVSTKTAQVGDYIYLRTATPIVADGRVLVPSDSYVQGVVSRVKRSGRVSGRAELAIRLETLTLAGGRTLKFAPRLTSVDAGAIGQKVDAQENTVQQSPERERDAARIAILAGTGATVGGLADESWSGAGIGAGVGSAVGLATVLLTRGHEVELRQGSTLDVTIERPLVIE